MTTFKLLGFGNRLFYFTGWRAISAEPFTLHCPKCGHRFQAANVRCAVCENCGEGGNLERFSARVRMAA